MRDPRSEESLSERKRDGEGMSYTGRQQREPFRLKMTAIGLEQRNRSAVTTTQMTDAVITGAWETIDGALNHKMSLRGRHRTSTVRGTDRRMRRNPRGTNESMYYEGIERFTCYKTTKCRPHRNQSEERGVEGASALR